MRLSNIPTDLSAEVLANYLQMRGLSIEFLGPHKEMHIGILSHLNMMQMEAFR